MSLRDQSLAESPIRQFLWGAGYLIAGIACVGSGNGALWVVFGGILVALGLFVLRHLVVKGTVLVVETDRTTGPINLECKMTDQEKSKFSKRLRKLEFPI
jgi:hypothetical protein